MSTITIGMPVYNGAATIQSALDSLLDQSFDDFVLVISDNCSTDETGMICRAYAERDKRITYVRQPVALTATMNFRFVLFEARTPYFMWAAADDRWAPDFIARNLTMLEQDPKAVASQSRVLFTVCGVASHLSNGTYPLLYDPGRNVVEYFSSATDNSRYYGVFRTAALQAVFPTRNFFALDWAVAAATLRYGVHVEVPDVLMVRDSSDSSTYARATARDHRFVVWQVFPVLFMTVWLLVHHSMPISRRLLCNLFKLNIHVHCLHSQYRWDWFARRYLKTGSFSATLRLIRTEKTEAIKSIGVVRKTMAVAKKMLRGLFAFFFPLWRTLPLTLEQRIMAKRVVLAPLRPFGRRAGTPPSSEGGNGAVASTPASGTVTRTAHPILPTGGWRMPVRTDGRPSAAAVIIVADGAVLNSLALIDSLAAAQDGLPLEIALVDNGSADVTSFVGDIFPGIIHVRLPHTVPYGEAATAGMNAVTADRMIFVEQKVLVHPNFPMTILSALDNAAMAGPQSRYPDGRLRAAGGIATAAACVSEVGRGQSSSDPDYLYVRNVDFCPAAFAIRRQTLIAIGGPARDYWGFEITNLDVAARIHAEGGQVLYCPAAVVTDYSDDIRESADIIPSGHQSRDWSLFLCRNHSFLKELELPAIGRKLPLDRSRLKRLLFIDAVTPAPDQNAGSIYVLNQMRILGDLGFEVTFVPEKYFVHSGKYTEQLQALGVHAIYPPFYRSVRDVLERIGHEFDVIVGCRVDVGGEYFDMVRELAPHARVVFNTIDLHALRAIREAELFKDPARLQAAKALWLAELAAISKADATIVVSSHEKELLSDELPQANIHVIPLITDIPERLETLDFDTRRDVVFVGTYQHPPNHDAAVYFARDIWPSIRERLPGARFLVVGSNTTPAIHALAGEGVEVIGFVEDLDGLLAASRLMVAPLRYGAGLKGKVLSGLRAGISIVATDVAIEGTELIDEQHVLVANTPEAIADAVVRLYTDQALWERLSQAGFGYARQEFSIERAIPRLQALMDSIGVGTHCRRREPIHTDSVMIGT
jgi:O-antigen biosynthesis protein